jgi:hypothetical protein
MSNLLKPTFFSQCLKVNINISSQAPIFFSQRKIKEISHDRETVIYLKVLCGIP